MVTLALHLYSSIILLLFQALVGAAFSLGFLFGPSIGAAFSILGKSEGSFSTFQYPAVFAFCLAAINILIVGVLLRESLPASQRVCEVFTFCSVVMKCPCRPVRQEGESRVHYIWSTQFLSSNMMQLPTSLIKVESPLLYTATINVHRS